MGLLTALEKEQAETIARLQTELDKARAELGRERLKNARTMRSEVLKYRDLILKDHRVSLDEANAEIEKLRAELEASQLYHADRNAEIARLRERLHKTAHILIEKIGADGPMDADEVAIRAAAEIARLRAELEATRAELAEAREAADPVRWHCGHCGSYFRGRHRQTCPECGKVGYWSGSFEAPTDGDVVIPLEPRHLARHLRGRLGMEGT